MKTRELTATAAAMLNAETRRRNRTNLNHFLREHGMGITSTETAFLLGPIPYTVEPKQQRIQTELISKDDLERMQDMAFDNNEDNNIFLSFSRKRKLVKIRSWYRKNGMVVIILLGSITMGSILTKIILT